MKRRRCFYLNMDGHPVRIQTNGYGHALTKRTIDALQELVKQTRKARARRG